MDKEGDCTCWYTGGEFVGPRTRRKNPDCKVHGDKAVAQDGTPSDEIGEDLLAENSVFRALYNEPDGVTGMGELMGWIARAAEQMHDGSADEWTANQAAVQLSLISKMAAQVASNVAEVPASALLSRWSEEVLRSEIQAGVVMVVEEGEFLSALAQVANSIGIENPLTGERVETEDDDA